VIESTRQMGEESHTRDKLKFVSILGFYWRNKSKQRMSLNIIIIQYLCFISWCMQDVL